MKLTKASKEYREDLRLLGMDKRVSLRKEQEAGFIVSFSILLSLGLIALALIIY